MHIWCLHVHVRRMQLTKAILSIYPGQSIDAATDLLCGGTTVPIVTIRASAFYNSGPNGHNFSPYRSCLYTPLVPGTSLQGRSPIVYLFFGYHSIQYVSWSIHMMSIHSWQNSRSRQIPRCFIEFFPELLWIFELIIKIYNINSVSSFRTFRNITRF